MPIKDPIRRAAHHKAYMKRKYHGDAEFQQRHKAQVRKTKRTLKALLRAMVIEARAKPCMDCNNTYLPCVMEFDHRPGLPKLFNIAAYGKAWSIKMLEDELAKCDLVCANCHRIRTFVRGQQRHGNRGTC